MGRMADARKRANAKRGKAGEPQEPPPGAEARPPDALPSGGPSSVGAPPAAPESASPEAAEAELVFPAEAEPRAAPRLELPASGTAEEILAQAAAAEAATDRAAAAAAAGETPGEAAVRAVSEAAALAEGQRSSSISFFSAPAREERAASEATEHLATFFLDREEYGVEVKLVQEIRRLTEVTPVPRAPDFIKGVINLRGRIIPVVDLKRKLRLGEVQEGRAARIVVVKIQDRLIGMMVDGASQVLKVPVSSVEPAPDEVVEKGGDYIRGVAKLEKRLIILVDLHRILRLDARDGEAPPAAERSA